VLNVFFLSGAQNDARKRLQRVLEFMLPKKNIVNIRTVKDMEAHLRKASSEATTVVILYVNKEKLAELIKLKKLFEDTSIILILNKKDNDTITLGYRLRPRFITSADSDFLDVASVLIKMKEKVWSEHLPR